MRKITLLFSALFIYCLLPGAHAQNYWQQEVNYTIDVSLNDNTHTLSGFEKIEYINNSPDTLRFIWFHVWPNAYKNDKTAFTDQQLENGDTRFYFSDDPQRGYINRLDFKVNNVTAALEDHPNYIDVIKLVLPSPLPPKSSVIITTPLNVKLPFNFSRGGHDGQSYQATQWYPKPAVYDKDGWHPMPYLDQGEFYSEFGRYDVSITLPKNYVVAASGALQNEEEKKWLITERATGVWGKLYRMQHPMKSYDTVRTFTPDGKPLVKTTRTKDSISNVTPPSSTEKKTVRYIANNVHDFAWFADKRFIVDYEIMAMPSGKTVELFSFYTPRHQPVWQHSLKYMRESLLFYSKMVGEYPYPAASAVQGPDSFGGGMEYPGITILSPVGSQRELNKILAHELGHIWFYGILASNERIHPWMDEGINSYYEMRYMQSNEKQYDDGMQQELLDVVTNEKMDQPISGRSENFTLLNYALIVYYKTSKWLELVEKQLGTETFNKAMQEYYRRWQFKHPQPADFKKALEESSGQSLDSVFALLDQKGALPAKPKKGIAFQLPSAIFTRQNKDKKSAVTIWPALGVNSYDKFMLGASITNLNIPHNRVQFWASPMYAFGSKSFAGIGFVNYSFFPKGIFRKINVGVNASTFTMDEFTPEGGDKLSMNFTKVAPGIKLILREKNPRSNMYRFIRFKTFLISEEGLRFGRDTIPNPPGPDTVINVFSKAKENRTLNQLQFVIENNRALYPYRGELKIEQGEDFVRTGFTGNYFFNYPKVGGLHVRLFAGKFIYTGSKTIAKQFATDRYHLNMTGPNGYEDYTYSDYFIGRNKFEGFASQQIMVRDGGFKVRTDLLADKVGRTDDWLAAINLSTSIPSAINPLSMLPVKIPLRLFVDIGTRAEAWKQDAEEDRFIFDAGLQVSLLKETINIYFPLVYSRVFKDYIQSTIEKKGRFWKTVSFSINISGLSARKLDRNLVF